jgi:hypothetical protein
MPLVVKVTGPERGSTVLRDLPEDITLADFKAAVEGQTGVPAAEQHCKRGSWS